MNNYSVAQIIAFHYLGIYIPLIIFSVLSFLINGPKRPGISYNLIIDNTSYMTSITPEINTFEENSNPYFLFLLSCKKKEINNFQLKLLVHFKQHVHPDMDLYFEPPPTEINPFDEINIKIPLSPDLYKLNDQITEVTSHIYYEYSFFNLTRAVDELCHWKLNNGNLMRVA